MSVFSRIRTSTFLLISIVLFGVMQLFSGGVFLTSLNQDREHLLSASTNNEKVEALTNSWYALNAVRADVNRVVLWILKEGPQSAKVESMMVHGREQLQLAAEQFQQFRQKAAVHGLEPALTTRLEQSYQAYYDILNQLMDVADKRNVDELFAINAAPKQQAMSEDYERWRAAASSVAKQVAEESNQTYNQMLVLLSAILVLVIAAIIICWIVISRVLLKPLNQALAHIDSIEAGDLTQHIILDTDSRTEMGRLQAGLMRMQTSLIRTVGNVRSGADIILTGVSEIALGNSDLSSRTEQQAASLEQTAASMEELTSTVKHNADNAHQAAQLALTATQTAENGGEIVNGVIKTMYGIEESSKKIGEITSVIESIAFQTNILALNAAVEAARAGENGRGFAVVAGEVRNLAQRSAVAAKDIKGLIEESEVRVSSGSQLAVSAEESMQQILKSVQQVRDIMDEISSASDEQSQGIAQVGVAVAELDRVTQQNAALVEESSAAAAQLEEQARHLNEAVAVFRMQTGNSSSVKRVIASRNSENSVKPAALAATADDNWQTF
ncbi:methyl-accepting chemotaxis protein [[Erwinia] mediterraneensis]|uniref:methyl-accepting chemotaxis protein n=1 Tax=[Erwinia] mediterraneensis TaxID=2161819 RepID=UPI00102FF67D|nr:methyl-accepting chemotaxis protein [[Erwinia] mediterraneensis]